MRMGQGEYPEDGHLVVFHYTTRTVEGAVVDSSKREDGGEASNPPATPPSPSHLSG